jgi:hypothetical protein
MSEEKNFNRRNLLKSAGVATTLGLAGISPASAVSTQTQALEIGARHAITEKNVDERLEYAFVDDMAKYHVLGDILFLPDQLNESERETIQNNDLIIRKRTEQGQQLIERVDKILPHHSSPFLPVKAADGSRPVRDVRAANHYNYPNIKLSYPEDNSVVVKVRGTERRFEPGTGGEVEIGRKTHQLLTENGEKVPVEIASNITVRNHGVLDVVEGNEN